MGMYSRYEIESLDKPFEEIFNHFENKYGVADAYEVATYYVFRDEGDRLVSEEDYKWYDWDKDMLEISKLHPECRFIVTRYYEEYDRSQRGFFFGGEKTLIDIKISWDDINWETMNVIY